MSKEEKSFYARKLLRLELPYREIQSELKRKYGSGVSNSTLKEIQDDLQKIDKLREENHKLRKELAMYKSLYFDLMDTMKKKFSEI